jgi:hypothetical protein
VIFICYTLSKGTGEKDRFIGYHKGRNKMEKLTKKEIKRMDDLYEKAVSFYLDKTDFNASDWLEEEESLEFAVLVEKRCNCN